jgi:hypothetical protein
MLPSKYVVDEGLFALTFTIWPIPAKVQKKFLFALTRSSCSRVKTLRHHLALVRYSDLDHFFQTFCTPDFLMHLLEDLVSTAALSRSESSMIQEAVLSGVGPDGAWLTYGRYREQQEKGKTYA